MRRLAPLLLSALTFLGHAPDAARAQSRGAHFQEGIELSSSEAGLEQGAVSTRFNLLELRDLWIRVRVARMPHISLLRLTFTSPRGEVFYETKLLYSREPRAMEVQVQGVPHLRTAFPAKRVPGGYALDQPIPIGAGVFMRYPQPGTWLVQATLDGHHEALAVHVDLGVAP